MKRIQLISLLLPVAIILTKCKESPIPEQEPTICRLTKETEQYTETRSHSISYEFQDEQLIQVVAVLEDPESSFSISARVSYDEHNRLSRLDVDENQYSILNYRGDTIEAIHRVLGSNLDNRTSIYLKDEQGNIVPLDGNEYIYNDLGQLTDIIFEEPAGELDPESPASFQFEYDDQKNPFQGQPSIKAAFLYTASGNPTKLMYFSFDQQGIQGPNNVTDFSLTLRTGNEIRDQWTYNYNDLGYPTEAKIGHSFFYNYDCY